MRLVTFVLVSEVKSGDWGIGGKVITTDAINAMAAARS